MAPGCGLRGPIPGEVIRQHLGVLLTEPCQFQVVRLRVRLVPVVLYGVVVGVSQTSKQGTETTPWTTVCLLLSFRHAARKS